MVLYILCVLFIASPFLPATEHPHWFFRTPDFVRLQSLFIQGVLLGCLFYFQEKFSVLDWVLTAALMGSMIYQFVKVYPYSSWYPRKKPHFPNDGCVSILAANVLQDNKHCEKFISLVDKYDPDLVLAMETNDVWEKRLDEIEDAYPYSVKLPKENYYGMHLYSKKELHKIKVNYLVEDDVPSIFFEYSIGENRSVFFACLHPAPPSPTENETSKERDAELMLVGEYIRSFEKPVVVCGDMNDVVWSRTTRLFKKMTGMIDPRVGRGFFPTYHAHYFFMRFPLDHLFHTKDLFVGKMERTTNFGSDHFGMYYEIYHKNGAKPPKNPKLNGDEKKEIKEIIDEK
ncbi:endonuclease/exonuclease/phosphatase family protein [Altibacter sp.]|uniref:endonuclease/exonuclease/phosphatase family protein n=1 Tax=Altibacter sp. TaxID=2024823 RepID=UPI0025888143|nr:endonuclease/exonuclease/phosphatase family protein [Altibacter sp.]MCW8981405.1 endonuclease/exonuclease/phosphatase family protein [Altibacter sp.]MCW9036721.1 endonuclease/exonuclease/phosphatase family protein [Altibacter sp.]